MTTEYRETIATDDDAEVVVLEALAGGQPHVFIVSTVLPDGGLNLRVVVGGGIDSGSTLRNLLSKTLDAIPEG